MGKVNAHDPYTSAGREGLARTVAYERKRFGAVRGTVAQRLVDALLDTHARPALSNPVLACAFDRVAVHIATGDVAGVAIIMAELVDEARTRLAELDGAR